MTTSPTQKPPCGQDPPPAKPAKPAEPTQPATLLARREIHPGKVVYLTVDRVQLPNDATVDLEMVQHPGAAAVVPVDDQGRVILVRQYRHATGGYLLEIPAGKLDDGEDPAVCAHRETEEETGLRVGRLQPLGWIWTTPGFSDEKIWLYLATELTPTRQNLEADEVLSIETLPFARACEMALDGTIVDGKSVCGLLRAQAHLAR
jgi:ADP-ribose pyrophosphatase